MKLEEIHVDRAIVHVIDHLRDEAPVSSDYEIPLTVRPKLREYFEGQVEKAEHAKTAYPARFEPAPSNGVPAVCYRMMESPEEHFVDASKQLARTLFAATGGNASISVGSLVCCLYSATNFPGLRFLGVIKIDLTEVLIQEVETDSKGHTTVTFSVHDDALPTLGAELLKAALIRPRSEKETEAELLLLDTQLKGEPAEFFTAKFLHATPILNRRQETRKLYSDLQRAKGKLSRASQGAPQILAPEELDRLDQHIDGWFHQQHVDTQADPANVRISEDPERDKQAKKVIEETLDKRLANRRIQIDPAVARQLVKKVRFKGDQGVAVEFEAHHAGEIYELIEEWDEGEDHVTVVQLTVRNLEWVTPVPDGN